MKIKAIETRYRGYRFRSRLEARWAVFFDSMGFDWEYECEGFELENGEWYLPDFKITTNTRNNAIAYCEVKPVDLDFAERVKCELLAKGLNEDVMLLVGIPDDNNYEVIVNHDKGIFTTCGYFEPTKFGVYYGGGTLLSEFGTGRSGDILIKSIQNAKGARFEHGEDIDYRWIKEGYEKQSEHRNHRLSDIDIICSDRIENKCTCGKSKYHYEARKCGHDGFAINVYCSNCGRKVCNESRETMNKIKFDYYNEFGVMLSLEELDLI